ncbi:tetratricopeptide repeat protein [Sphaerothrix gracilis]|uniref:tetratricopeptide repeat protein n=1 Tax=Sphaerothrix gracilis TaxID=3151835 RepID=UPI0031FD92FD
MRRTSHLLNQLAVAMGSLLVFTSPVLAHTPGQSLSDQARLNELADLLESGEELVESGSLTEALSRYQHAASLDSENPKIFSAIGYLQARQGNFQESVVAFQTALELDPENLPFYFGLAYSQSQLEAYEATANTYR